jgi:RHS repeat-associated protein
MKNITLMALALVYFLSVDSAFAAEATIFGPKQYVRTSGSPDVFGDTFVGVPGKGRLIVKNGNYDGGRRVENGLSNATVSINGSEIYGPNDFNQNVYQMETTVDLVENNTIDITLASSPDSFIAIEVIEDVALPVVTISTHPDFILIGESTTLTWTATHAKTCSIEPGIGTVPLNGSISIAPTETTTYTITASGLGGASQASASIHVSDEYQPPMVEFTATPAAIQQGQSATLSWSSSGGQNAMIDNGIGVVAVGGSAEVAPAHTTVYTITVTGPSGSSNARIMVMVSGDPEPQPEASFGEQYQDLVPPDATVAFYDPRRFSVITGLVHSIDDLPISGVSIKIHGHPEYGTAFTDLEGRFSLPAEGGGTLIVAYEKGGLMQVHKKLYVPWNDIAVVETIQMIAEDSRATTITFDGDPQKVMTHESTLVSDGSGSRSCTLVFKGDNHGYLLDEAGEMALPLTTLRVRATEYTTEPFMPAPLPPQSAYTYCVELQVDGAERVRFEKPVVMWVDNFLGFEVGTIVPVGYYNRDRGVWEPEENGKVVKLLDLDSDGRVDGLDATGDDLPDDLNQNGDMADEVVGLHDPARYPPGGTFWRVERSHFSPLDLNWAYRVISQYTPLTPSAPDDAISPNPEGNPDADQQLSEDCNVEGKCFVESKSRIFHEDVSIPGTDLTLHYASNRVPGYLHGIAIPASAATVPEGLQRIIVRMNLAGRTFEEILPPLPDQSAYFVWDGKDYRGTSVLASETANILIGFVYKAVYAMPPPLERAFAALGWDLTRVLLRKGDATVWKSNSVRINPKNPNRGPRGLLAEGWSLSSHHFFNVWEPQTLYTGGGTVVSTLSDSYKYSKQGTATMVEIVAGQGTVGDNGDGGPATAARIYPEDLTMDGEGNLYFLSSWYGTVRKIDRDGIITRAAGGGSSWLVDGIPATEASLSGPVGLAVDPSGNVYIADRFDQVIRKVDAHGIITTIAGGGNPEDEFGDGLPATQAKLDLARPSGVAADIWGNIYIADTLHHRVRKVDPMARISTVAGGSSSGYTGDGGPAAQSLLCQPLGVAVDSRGHVYIADTGNRVIRKINPSGTITTIAGGGSLEPTSGQGIPATEIWLDSPWRVTLDPEGNLYICDHGMRQVLKVDTTGVLTTVIDSSARLFSADGPAVNDWLNSGPSGIAVDDEGRLYVAYQGDGYVCRAGPVVPYLYQRTIKAKVFAEANGLGHVMSDTGQHLKTVALDTGTVLRAFEYDDLNRLIGIKDAFDNEISIQRDGSGIPTAITSPDGLRTQLIIDENNRLTSVSYADGAVYRFEYDDGGLMTTKIDPEGNRFIHVFDPLGRLMRAEDEEGGAWEYSRVVYQNSDIESEVLTAEGNLTSYLDHRDGLSGFTSRIVDPSGGETLYNLDRSGMAVTKSLPCGMDLWFSYDMDPENRTRFVNSMTETAPSGLVRATTTGRVYRDFTMDDVPDMITKTVTVNGKKTIIENDLANSAVNVTSPESRTVTIQYDPSTLVPTRLSVSGLHETIYGHDTKGRPTSTTMNARQTLFGYTPQGFLQSVTDAENRTTAYTHDQVGRVTGVLRPDGSSLGFTYDMNGNMTVVVNPALVEHGFEYNKVNLNSHYYTPISGTYQYVYDRDRRLIRTIFPSGFQINNVYDKTRLIQVQAPERNLDFTYLCGTKVGSITDGTESIGYGYDGKLVTSETLSGTLNQTFSYIYNNDFNVQSFTHAGATTSYTYDNDGLLTGSGPFTITRNAQNGLPETISGGALSMSRAFNGYGEEDIENFKVGGRNVASWSLGRDRNGKITSKAETVDGITANYAYTYDAMGRLLTVIRDDVLLEDYRYDQKGLRTYEMNTLRGIPGRNLEYSDEEHLLTAGDALYQYDVDGFLVSKTVGTQETQYHYSSRGELLQVILPDGRKIEYLHDPLGRRIAKKVDGAVVEKYLLQGMTRLLAIYDGSDNLVARFQYADGRMPVAMTVAGNTYYLTYDQVGSLRAVFDSSGIMVKRIDYDSFGNPLQDTNPLLGIPFGFAGGLWDPNTGLLRFGYRDYDPDIGRWTAKDPILFTGGATDLYGYCFNDPMNLTDSSGLLTADWHFGITLVAALNSGMGFRDSLNLAWKAVAVDFESGSQGFGVEATVQHAMAGELPDGARQSSNEAIFATKNLIQSDKNCGNIGEAAHAAQDLATPGHAGQPWMGFGWNWNSFSHVLGDLAPSPSTISQAYRNTLEALK